jgi:hypothetical protein
VLPVTCAAVAQSFAASNKSALRLNLRPVLQAIGHTLGEILQGLFGAQVMNTWHTIAQFDAGHAKGHGTEFWGCHVGLVGSIFIVIWN